MKENSIGLKWGIRHRLEFIEFRLFWEGAINRGDITDFFSVSVPQASKDLSQYQEMAPGNLEYDKSKKRYFASKNFKTRFFTPNSDQYLSQLRLTANDNPPAQGIWLSKFPDFALMPTPHRTVDPIILHNLLAVIRDSKSIEILYQSMNPKYPDVIWRGVTPHAFGSDGLRWHVRAYCHIDHKFKDFLLSRCLKCRNAGEAKAMASDDKHWQETIDIKLKPNPNLSESQQRIIAYDYNMKNNYLLLTLRKSLVYYFNKRLRFDVAEDLDNPQGTPIVVANQDAYEKVLATVTGE